MKYMLMRKADADTEKGVMPSEDLLQSMADYNERMTRAGVFAEGQDFEPSQSLEQHRSLGCLPREMNVHVAFAGTCKEAMEFYSEVTTGKLESMITYGETPAAEDVPPEMHDRIVHSSLNLRGRRLMGADMAGNCYQPPQGAQIHLEYDDPEQAGRVFKALSDGGSIIMPFAETFWAHRFGMTTDRFGIQWMISSQIEHCQ
ncbi:MAG: VOC family protein [Marinobacter sp.]|uniref:VOC family protein n=1 Tax=Marinobacter sp. TaxID=50741 RepID=UPI00396D6822